ncbi:sensor histidine kinase [Herpetosiphon giganteus]|uniref:sensor histidine kinase n=1 Tax=Herpetosiphon giganteus TaxID=2029754 RepID=UPI001EF8256D|nr:HAMP domain-containing sensor histidine kinase [Herpetosiphon giganteus]MBM7846730.1 signal transduction histidine kinase [Herpetosiphon giganteus]
MLATRQIDVILVRLPLTDTARMIIQALSDHAAPYPLIFSAPNADNHTLIPVLHGGVHATLFDDDLTPAFFQRTLDYAFARVAHRAAEEHVQTLTSTLAVALDTTHQIHHHLTIAIHELQTPISILLGYIDLLERRVATWGGIPLRERHMINTMRMQAIHVGRLVPTLLDSTLMTHDLGPIQRRSLDLRAVLRTVVDAMHGMRAAHLLVLRVPDEAIWIAGDYGRLVQIFQNLVLNALHYSGMQSAITITLAADGQITIQDSGVGIAADDLEQIFRPFFDTADPHGAARIGQGLGLAIVQELIQQHEGSITIASAVDHGTTITIQFPGSVRPPRLPEHLSALLVNAPSSAGLHGST